MTLADKVFNYQNTDSEIFNKLCAIIGDVDDNWYDSYDGSIEVIIPKDVPSLNREKANKILDMGFDVVYASQGYSCVRWTRKDECPAAARQSNVDKNLLIKREA